MTEVEAVEGMGGMQDRDVGGFKAELEEEFEDAEGNVYTRKVYEDLKRQGLID